MDSKKTMFTIPTTTKHERFLTRTNARRTLRSPPLRFGVAANHAGREFGPCVVDEKTEHRSERVSVFSQKSAWLDEEHREGYLEASVEQGIAWQIRVNREARNLTQGQLAERMGKQQSAISRLEDVSYGAYSLETLLELANAFDCALQVRFVSFSYLAVQSHKLSTEHLFAAPFSEEKDLFHG